MSDTHPLPDAFGVAGAAMAGPYRLAAVPDGLAHHWLAVWSDRYGTHWIEAGEEYYRVTRNAAGNWITIDGEPLISTHDGSVLSPADDPLTILDLIATPLELEAEILTVAAERLERGEALDIAAEARVRIARRRLGEVAA